MKRTGDCFVIAAKRMLDDPELLGRPATLVHGLPKGTSGDAAKAGRYPHAWLEIEGLCWDPVVDVVVDTDRYYELGQIEYTVRYSRKDMVKMMADRETYGPWDGPILKRDDVLQDMIDENNSSS